MLKMVTNHISAVLKQALATFSCKSDVFYQNLEILKTLLDKVTATDVNLHPRFMSEAIWKNENKAPVTYIDIYEDCNVSVGVFVLKPGMKLPLHDHPQMYGLIKIIEGTIKITSYSLQTDAVSKIKSVSSVYSTSLIVERSLDLLADKTTETFILEPEKGNLHEIESIGGPAAFLDILSPPYETYIPNLGPRKCSYYKIVKEVAPQLYKIETMGSPSWYWNDTYPYSGPQLF